MSSPRPVAIAGGGIGGLAAATALAREGIDSVVFEKQAAVLPQGSAFLIAGNAVKALHEIGLAEAYARISKPREIGELRTYRGKLLAAFPSRVLVEGLGFPNTNVERSDLRAMLLHAAGKERLRLGAPVRSFEETADGVTIATGDRSGETFSALIGADGLGSAVRSQLLGPTRAKYVGYSAWQGVSREPIDCPPGIAREIWGLGRRGGYCFLGDGRWGWWASALAPEGTADPTDGRAEAVAAPYADWWGHTAALIRATPPDKILRNDIRVRPPDREWGRGRVTLLGDAAHLMTPDLGQGACQAIIDAVVLARCLRGAGDASLGDAMRRYEAIRRPASAFIAKRSRRVGRHAHYRSAGLFAFRNAVLKSIPESIMFKNGVRTLQAGGVDG